MLVQKTAPGLDVDLPDPAELVELIDVHRAHVRVQRGKHVSERHPHLLGLLPIDVDVELGRISAKGGENARQSWLVVCLFNDGFGNLLQALQAHAGAVLDLELETARLAQARHRRGAEHGSLAAEHLLVILDVEFPDDGCGLRLGRESSAYRSRPG